MDDLLFDNGPPGAEGVRWWDLERGVTEPRESSRGVVGADLPCRYVAWVWETRESGMASLSLMGSLTVRGARERWLMFVVERFLRLARSEC